MVWAFFFFFAEGERRGGRHWGKNGAKRGALAGTESWTGGGRRGGEGQLLGWVVRVFSVLGEPGGSGRGGGVMRELLSS